MSSCQAGPEATHRSDEPPTATIIPLRPPGFWVPTVVASAGSLLVLGSLVAILLIRGNGAPGSATRLCILLAAGLGLWQLIRPRTVPPVEIGRDVISFPRSRVSRRRMRIPLHRVYSFQHLERGWPRRWVLGVEGRLPVLLPDAAFESPSGGEQMRCALRQAIRALPAGRDQLGAFDQRTRVGSRARRGTPFVALGATFAIVAVFAIEVSQGALSFGHSLVPLGANSAALVEQGEFYRLVTANLLHLDFDHILFNAIGILVFGFAFERLIGSARFLVVLLGGALCGATASSLLAAHALSVGASAGVYGLFGAFLWVVFLRRQELPSPLRLPLWWWLGVIGLAVMFDNLVPAADTAAHVGGAMAGFTAMALMGRGRRMLDFETPGRWLRLIAAVLAGVFIAGAAQGAYAWMSWNPARARTTWAMLLKEDLHPSMVNNLAWEIASDPDAPAPLVELASRAMESHGEAYRDSAAPLDTMAQLAWRAGDTDRAIELERRAFAATDARFHVSQLARFELARHERTREPARIGSPRVARVGLVDALGDEPGPRVLAVEVDQVPVELHIVTVRDGDPVGFFQVHLGPGAEHNLRIRAEKSPHRRYEDVRVEVVLLDTSPPHLDPEQWSWRYWDVDPDVLELP